MDKKQEFRSCIVRVIRTMEPVRERAQNHETLCEGRHTKYSVSCRRAELLRRSVKVKKV